MIVAMGIKSMYLKIFQKKWKYHHAVKDFVSVERLRATFFKLMFPYKE